VYVRELVRDLGWESQQLRCRRLETIVAGMSNRANEFVEKVTGSRPGCP